ncbi:MAG: hypothetical protein AAF658_11975 [Myxococcota bacterium]
MSSKTVMVIVLGSALLALLFGLYFWSLDAPGEPMSSASAVGDDPVRPEIATETQETETVVVAPLTDEKPHGEEGRHPVDLDKIREELPDNLYWMLGVPTENEAILERRKRWKDHDATLKGRVTSGTAAREEIDEYFARRERMSRDFVTFATRVLERYGDELPEQELGLYGLSVRMHVTRLEELPKERVRAYEFLALQ